MPSGDGLILRMIPVFPIACRSPLSVTLMIWREMERAIDRLLAQPLGRALLEGRFAEGTTVRVDAGDGELLLDDAERTRPVDLGQLPKEDES